MGVVSRDRLGREPTVWTTDSHRCVCGRVHDRHHTERFVMTPDVVAHSMRLSGMSPAEAANASEGLYTVGLPVIVMYIIGNALGVLALRGWAWMF